MTDEDLSPILLVNHWVSDDNSVWECVACLITLDHIRMIETARILRQLGGSFPTPHKVYAVIFWDKSSLYIEPDQFATDFIEAWLERHQTPDIEIILQDMEES